MEVPSVPQRIAPGRAGSLSAITVSLGGPASIPGVPSLVVPLLRRARSLGVTTFDLTGSAGPALSEQALVQAFPEKDPAIAVIVRRPPRSVPLTRGPRSPIGGSGSIEASRLAESIGPTLDRLEGRYRVLVEWTPSDGDSPVPGSLPPALAELRDSRRVAEVVVGLRPDADPMGFPLRGLCSGPHSLIDLRILNAVRRSGPLDGFGLIARDVFAGGSLDGSLLGTALGVGGPSAPPPSLAELHRRLDPILRLGFLTRRPDRTLARAALDFALQWPWVITAVVPLPPPERLAATLAAPGGSPLSEVELAELGAEGPAPGAPLRNAPG